MSVELVHEGQRSVRPVGTWAAGNGGAASWRKYAGFALVLALHVLFIWALKNGLANKVVQVIQKPIEAKIIEPIKPPPPPPVPIVKEPPPKIKPPPRPFVPPPEVHVATPPPVAPIAHQADPVTTPVTPAPVVEAPPAPPAPAKPVSHEIGVVCPNAAQVRAGLKYPAEAQDNGITGDVLISFVVDEQGHVTDEKVEQSADPVLDRAAFNVVKKFNCISQGQAVRVQVPFSFNLN
ncbi:energy transducer TonB [Pararobbsia silviterrae]|uniref:Protein TonB n=1 Tax=Pararobbsia silviterrae TaxID=1792498 RepID=A0A494X9E6_9BURK|nr:energy transducer TonB [Pararobbsia silviterrae]RKP47090.1 energy transducer TonB [Pararobbsia silviterrae]